MDIRNFFTPSPNDPLDGRALNPSGSSTSSQVFVARELNALHVEKSTKKKRQTIPEKIRKSVAVRAWKYGIPAGRKWMRKITLTTNSLQKLSEIGKFSMRNISMKRYHQLMDHLLYFLSHVLAGHPH